MAAQGTDFPLGGTVITGSARSIFEVVFGHSPREHALADRALADLRRCRTLHSLHTVLLRDFPTDADRVARRQQVAREANEAIAKLKVARMQARRAAA